MADLRPVLQRACARLWFDRITVLGREHLPKTGPALYLGLHRNGAVDAFVHRCVAPRAKFLIAPRWRKGPVRRALFDGIVVVRDKDGGDRTANAASLAVCADHLRKGGEIDVFPEGTSSLGPRHLPFKTGAARILAAFLEDRREIIVLPIGLHYERAWAFRSRVEIVVGRRIDVALPAGIGPEERIATLQARIVLALESVAVDFGTEDRQELVERLAYAATLGTSIPYFRALKAFEREIPEDVRRSWDELVRDPAVRRAWFHQGIPLVPIGSVRPYAAALLVVGPVVVAALAANLPPLLLAVWAGKTLPDERNVIALWRILVGVPAFLAWGAIVIAAAFLFRVPLAAIGWGAFTCAGLLGGYRVKKLAVAVHNAAFCGSLGGRLLDLHRRTVDHVRRSDPT